MIADKRSTTNKAIQHMMNLKTLPTDIFCADDAIASYTITVPQEMGIRVPEDVSIIGYDNRSFLPSRYVGTE